MTKWRVTPAGERQYLGEDGYWYVALPPPPPMAQDAAATSAPAPKKDWDEDDRLLRGTLGVVGGGLMGVGRRRGSNIEWLEAEKERRRIEKVLRRAGKKKAKATRREVQQ